MVEKLLESFETPGISEIHGMTLDEGAKDYEKVLNLFISRFLIKSPEKDSIFYALKSDPSEFLYTVYADRFDDERGMYEICVNRNTDTVQNYFYYDDKTGKFYYDGTDHEEIKSDDGIFFWSLF